MPIPFPGTPIPVKSPLPVPLATSLADENPSLPLHDLYTKQRSLFLPAGSADFRFHASFRRLTGDGLCWFSCLGTCVRGLLSREFGEWSLESRVACVTGTPNSILQTRLQTPYSNAKIRSIATHFSPAGAKGSRCWKVSISVSHSCTLGLLASAAALATGS